MTVRIVADSVSDLPPNIADELNVTVVPANVHFGAEVFKDGVDLQTEEFFERLLNGPDYPTTSQPTVGDFMETYQSVAPEADGIVSIHVSGKLSGTLNSAQQGAERANVACPIEVLDTQQASMAVGLDCDRVCARRPVGRFAKRGCRGRKERDSTLPLHSAARYPRIPGEGRTYWEGAGLSWEVCLESSR